MRWIEWAFSTELPTAEKLVLVYLAWRANHAGVGLMDRDELARLTGYEKRSVQRLLKRLRDLKLLTDGGPWYVLLATDAPGLAPATIDALPPPVDGAGPAPAGGLPNAFNAAFPPDQVEAVADRIGAAIQDGAEFLVDQLDNFQGRLASELVRGSRLFEEVLLAAQRLAPQTPPPPDPVAEHPLYAQLLGMGMAEDLVRTTVQAQMDRDAAAGEPVKTIIPVKPILVGTPKRDAYTDDVSGRFMRVWDILHDHPPTEDVLLELGARWSMLEDEENKQSVAGESVTAFEQLYPAIVEAARQRKGQMPMREFLDARAIAECRAPWDQDPRPAPAEDAVLEAEIRQMLGELNAVNDPRCKVQPRTKEKGDDGVTRTESITGYYRRVKAKHAEMLKLKQMGALS